MSTVKPAARALNIGRDSARGCSKGSSTDSHSACEHGRMRKCVQDSLPIQIHHSQRLREHVRTLLPLRIHSPYVSPYIRIHSPFTKAAKTAGSTGAKITRHHNAGKRRHPRVSVGQLMCNVTLHIAGKLRHAHARVGQVHGLHNTLR